MRLSRPSHLALLAAVPMAATLVAIAADPPARAPAASTITWKKTVLDPVFHSEGCAAFDVNNDGKIDVVAGEFWYEAPNWTRHEMQKPGNYVDGDKNIYSKVFCVWPADLNKDGFTDAIIIPFPGDAAYWMENPKGKGTDGDKPTHWKKHPIWHSACNETPQYVDLFGTGKKVLLMGFQPKDSKDGNSGQMGYFTPNEKDPYATWDMHPISDPAAGPGKGQPGTMKFSHGLGIGDLNGDKKMDVITLGGWWEQPSGTDGKTPWKFHPGGVDQASSDLFAFDVDGDGKNDILATSAHKYGIWWYKQREGKDHPVFTRNDIFPELVSETHSAHFVDIDGDGQPDLVTGKRYWSHGRKGEPGADKPAMLYWLKVTREKDGMAKFTPMEIDNDGGVGTQFTVADINGDKLLDIVVSNKKGVHIHIQQRK